MRKTFVGLGSVVLLGWIILGAGCSFDKPISPRWDMQLVIPLSEQRYTLQDLVDTSTALDTTGAGIAFTEDSLLYFFYQDSIPEVLIGDSIYIPPQKDTLQTGLDDLELDAGLNQTVGFSLGSLNPAMGAFNHQVVQVPAFSFVPTTDELAPLENLEYAVIESGYLHYTVTNGFPVPIDQVRFRLFPTAAPGHIIVDETLAGTLQPGASITDSVSLAGTRLEQYNSIEISGHSPGSAPNTVLVDTSASLTVQVSAGTVTVIAARGMVPSQTVTQDSLYALESEHTIRSAGIQQGHIYLHSYNETALSAQLRIRVFNFTSPAGDTLESEMAVGPNSSVEHSIDLAGYTLRIPDPSNQVIHAYMEAQVDSSQGMVDYANSQDVYATMETDTIYLSYIDGILSPVLLSIEPMTEAVEQVPEGWEQLHFVDASLSLDIQSDIQVPITTNLHLVAWREGIPRDSVIVNRTIIPNQDTSLVVQGLEQLLDDRPDTLKVWGDAGLQGDVYLVATNYLRGTLRVEVPLSFTAEPTTVNGDIQETTEAIDENEKVRSATVETVIHNHLPLSGNVVVLVTHDSTLFRTNPGALDTLISLVIAMPTISGGRVVAEATSEPVIALSDSMIQWFRTVPVYTRAIFHLNGTEDDTLSAYGSDYLGFSAIAWFVYEVDTE